MTQPLLVRYEAAMLLAVDGANGGELAGLEQVLVAFEVLFHHPPTVSESAEAIALLSEAGFVEYVQDQLGLTPQGRKLLRRAGLPESPDRPRKVAHLLGELEEIDLAAEGSVPAPTEADLAAALHTLGSDQLEGVAPMLGADVAGPDVGSSLSLYGSILGGGVGLGGIIGGQRWRVELDRPSAPDPAAPTVSPLTEDEPDGGED